MAHIPELFGSMSSSRRDMKERVSFLILLVCVAMATKVGSAQADDISVMRMHLECGWLEQLSAGDTELDTEAAEYHIVVGSELAADLGLEREELAEEVSEAYTRVINGDDSALYLRRALIQCRE